MKKIYTLALLLLALFPAFASSATEVDCTDEQEIAGERFCRQQRLQMYFIMCYSDGQAYATCWDPS